MRFSVARDAVVRIPGVPLLALAGGLSIALGLLVFVAGALGASPPWVADSDASAFLQYSVWAYENDVTDPNCSGTGAPHRFASGTGHTTFRCAVEADGKKGVILAKALGPEWLRVTQVPAGFGTDQGLGAIPSGKPLMDDDQAESALADSAWGSKENVDEAFCSGVGSYSGTLETTDDTQHNCCPG